MKRICLIRWFFAISTLLLQSSDALGDIVFAPTGDSVFTDGSGSLSPFSPGADHQSRFMQLYDASIFKNIAQGGGFITGIAFRGDPYWGTVGLFVPKLQINFSITQKSVSTMSSVFSENVGSGETVVFAAAPVGTGFTGGGGHSGYSTLLGQDKPYFYDPSKGNLLIDIQVLSGSGIIFTGDQGAIFDGWNVDSDGIASVYNQRSETMPTTGVVSTFGLATAFFITPIPEPSTVGLGLGGLGLLWFFGQRIPRKGKTNVAA